MPRNCLTGVVIAVFVVTGCGGSGGGRGNSLAGATPQATLEAMKNAALKDDWAGWLSCYTAESQDMSYEDAMLVIGPASQAGDSEILKSATDIFIKYGIKPEDAKIDPQAADLRERVMKMYRQVKDKPACFAEFMALYPKMLKRSGDGRTEERHQQEKKQDIAGLTLSDIEINGADATGELTIHRQGNEETQEVQFKKVDGKWYGHMWK